MPVFYESDILDNKVIGREIKRRVEEGREEGRKDGIREGELAVLRRIIAQRFGAVPRSLDKRLEKLSQVDLDELCVRVVDARTVKDLLP